MPPLNLYARVRFCCALLHTRPRVQRAPGIPCSLVSRGAIFVQNFGRSAPRECGSVSERHCDPLARNDVFSCLKTESLRIHCLRTRHAFHRHHPRMRVIQYSRDADDGIEKPRRTGYPDGARHRAHQRRDPVAGDDEWEIASHSRGAMRPSCA